MGIDRSQRGIPTTQYRSTKFSFISLIVAETGLQANKFMIWGKATGYRVESI